MCRDLGAKILEWDSIKLNNSNKNCLTYSIIELIENSKLIRLITLLIKYEKLFQKIDEIFKISFQARVYNIDRVQISAATRCHRRVIHIRVLTPYLYYTHFAFLLYRYEFSFAL